MAANCLKSNFQIKMMAYALDTTTIDDYETKLLDLLKEEELPKKIKEIFKDILIEIYEKASCKDFHLIFNSS